MKKLLLLSLIAFTTFGMYGQKQISGKVLDSLGIAIEGIEVQQKGTKNETFTDENGEYLLNIELRESKTSLIFKQEGDSFEVALGSAEELDLLIDAPLLILSSVCPDGEEVRYPSSNNAGLNAELSLANMSASTLLDNDKVKTGGYSKQVKDVTDSCIKLLRNRLLPLLRCLNGRDPCVPSIKEKFKEIKENIGRYSRSLMIFDAEIINGKNITLVIEELREFTSDIQNIRVVSSCN